jgi:hypothetical protein
MGNTGMYVRRAALALLIACHGSTPSTSHGSGTGSGTAETAGAVAPSAPQQNEAQSPGNHPPEPTSGRPSGTGATAPTVPTATGSTVPTGSTTTGATATTTDSTTPPAQAGSSEPIEKVGNTGATGKTGSTGKRGSPGSSGKSGPGSTGSAGSRAGPGIEEPCGPDDTCAPGLTCIAYYGFAGARGPQFKTCEIRCKDDSSCPKGRNCATVSDGPGRVCR